ncbi:hypothetical protein CAPTEDRAFT_228057 [Capitella teleta]|uniref:Sodium-coupled monocarboxylate transporter 1 n=1 Tax=Capitella teleta TaxID=283909 RepID=R7TH99_CAPTE|nr:hypothetical protein CAPTEDRAFT_228057 [Capitella teleta]|eukprot:ELT92802.1 hypothetical protein CAPTEDRAFT_228057 [Capitella teleta]
MCYHAVFLRSSRLTPSISPSSSSLSYRWFPCLDPSPSTRASFWSVNLIFPFYWMALMTSSPVVQHLLSMQSLAKSRMSLVTSGMLLFVLISCSILLGVLAFYYNTSKGCNPVHSALVITHEQILAHYVIRILDDPGLSGLYTITILVCAISHCSSSQVNIACCVWEDLFKGRFFHVSERIRSSVSRSAALLSGIVSLSLALPVALILPSFDIFEIFIGVTGCLAGPIFGVLVVGSTLPFVGSFGVFFGAVVGLFLTLPLAIGKLFYPHPFASTLLLNCSSSNVDNLHQPLTTPVTWPHMATFLSYPFIGVASCFVFGSLLSLIPNLRSEVINPECLLPCVQWLRKKYSDTWCGACCVEVDAVDCSAAMRASPMFQDTSHIIHKRLMLDGDKSPATHQRLITVDTETVV